MKTKLPNFNGTPLIEISEGTSQAGFLDGYFGIKFLDEYKERVKGDYHGNSALDVLRYSENIVKGSNPFAVVLANQILRQEGLKTASQADLEKILKTGAFDLTGTCEDTGLVLRSIDEPNKYLAKDLADQIIMIQKNLNMPIMIPLNNLALRINQDSPYGLSFNLRDDAELVYAPILAGKNYNRQFLKTDKYGLPKKFEKENRTLRTLSSGLSRLCLLMDFDIESGWENLVDSGDKGRIVVVKERK